MPPKSLEPQPQEPCSSNVRVPSKLGTRPLKATPVRFVRDFSGSLARNWESVRRGFRCFSLFAMLRASLGSNAAWEEWRGFTESYGIKRRIRPLHNSSAAHARQGLDVRPTESIAGRLIRLDLAKNRPFPLDPCLTSDRRGKAEISVGCTAKEAIDTQ